MTNTQTFIKQHPCINDEKIAKNVFWLLTREISNNKSYECTQTLRQVFSEINQEKKRIFSFGLIHKPNDKK